MTEAEWLTKCDPVAMLEFLGEKQSERKLRLFAVACCRDALASFDPSTDKQIVIRKEVEIAEQVADGLLVNTRSDLSHHYGFHTVHHNSGSDFILDWVCHSMFDPSAWGSATESAPILDDGTWHNGPTNFGSLALRDIFGNPFRPVAVEPAWLTEAAVGIARGIYDDRAFERLPILADALQDAGCEHEQVLSHCREPGTHVRGCWVVDLVLGKS